MEFFYFSVFFNKVQRAPKAKFEIEPEECVASVRSVSVHSFIV